MQQWAVRNRQSVLRLHSPRYVHVRVGNVRTSRCKNLKTHVHAVFQLYWNCCSDLFLGFNCFAQKKHFCFVDVILHRHGRNSVLHFCDKMFLFFHFSHFLSQSKPGEKFLFPTCHSCNNSVENNLALEVRQWRFLERLSVQQHQCLCSSRIAPVLQRKLSCFVLGQGALPWICLAVWIWLNSYEWADFWSVCSSNHRRGQQKNTASRPSCWVHAPWISSPCRCTRLPHSWIHGPTHWLTRSVPAPCPAAWCTRRRRAPAACLCHSGCRQRRVGNYTSGRQFATAAPALAPSVPATAARNKATQHLCPDFVEEKPHHSECFSPTHATGAQNKASLEDLSSVIAQKVSAAPKNSVLVPLGSPGKAQSVSNAKALTILEPCFCLPLALCLGWRAVCRRKQWESRSWKRRRDRCRGTAPTADSGTSCCTSAPGTSPT